MEAATFATLITGLVSAISAYMKYKVDMKQTEQEGIQVPGKTKVVEQGEQALVVVERGIKTHGSTEEQDKLSKFEKDPDQHEDLLKEVLNNISRRVPAFAEQLQTLAQRVNIMQPGSMVVNIENQASNYGAQGTFNAPINFNVRPESDDKS